MKVPEVSSRQREVWSFRQADWEQLEEKLMSQSWCEWMELDVNSCVKKVTSVIVGLSESCIPERVMIETNRVMSG